MKKHIIYVGALLAMASLFPSCAEDFLETKPLTQKTDANYYTTPAEFETAMVGCYDALQSMDMNELIYLYPQIASDESFGSAGSGDDAPYYNINEYADLTALWPDRVNPDWESYYKGINKVNTIIKYLDNVKWDNAEKKNDFVSQARFIRAFFYFNLIRSFGQCPLLTEPSIENLPCSDYKAVYKVIFDDMKFAADNGASGKYDGHITKQAAEGMLARIYLYYTGYYGEEAPNVTKDEVIAYLKDITTAGYGLVDNPFQLWNASAQYKAYVDSKDFHNCYKESGKDYSYAGELNQEVIFSIRHTATGYYKDGTDAINDALYWAKYVCPRPDKGGGMPKMEAAKPYGYGGGWGIANPSAAFVATFEPGDMRKEASVINVKEELGAEFDENCGVSCNEYNGYYVKKYNGVADTYVNEKGNEVYDWVGKINNPTGHDNLCFAQDYIILRYADVLLMLSELEEDASYMNQVRKRAGLDEIAYSKEALFMERAHELCYEGVRYWDMLRYDGIKGNFAYAQKCLAGSNNGSYEVISAGATKTITIDYKRLEKTHGLFPIPLTQIEISAGVIEQNEGYK